MSLNIFNVIMETAIEKNTLDLVQSLSEIYLIRSNHIESVPDPDANFELDFTNFSLKTGKSFEKIYFSPHSGNFQENENFDDPGKIYSKKIGFRIPKNRSAVTSWLRTRQNFLYSALVRSADNNWWFIEKNLRLTSMRSFPESPERYTGYEITMQGKHNEPAPLVNNVLTDTFYFQNEDGTLFMTEISGDSAGILLIE